MPLSMLEAQLERAKYSKAGSVIDPLLQQRRDVLISDIDRALKEQGRDLRALIDLLERTSRLVTDCLVGVPRKEALRRDLAQQGEPTWQHKEGLNLPHGQAEAIARQLFVSSRAIRGDRVVIQVTPESQMIAEALIRICDQEGVDFDLDFVDHTREALLVQYLSDEVDPRLGISPLEIYARTRLKLYWAVNKMIQMTTNRPPRIAALVDAEKWKAFAQKLGPIRERKRSGDLHYILTILPTEEDAKLDQMTKEDYVRLFLEACDQPWEEIKRSQAILIERLNRANRVRITNDDGTDVTLDITGQTFANSTVLKNLPGSEIFSSPLREGVNGHIVAQGRFQYEQSGIIEDITLVFQNGRIVGFDARAGEEALARIIHSDDGHGEGTRFLGELGFGTNPHLRRHVVNGLLVEKIGGSFHVAIGACYSYDVYDGTPVRLKNGNKSHSNTHWDVTTLLRGKGGEIELTYPDGTTEVVQENGDWTVPGCEVLNHGWGALPPERQPAWWKERFPKGYEERS